MINYKGLNNFLEDEPHRIDELIVNLEAEVKYEQSQGLEKMTEAELEYMARFRDKAIKYGIFTLEHPILEDDLNLLQELRRIA